MATTTPNFGWSVPTSTDLVKDGATAIETLGDAIDASLVDLKGGTTGQVLAKASNTDMDFVWSADASGIPATIFDAKGDIIAATAADTASRLAVGSNGTVLTANSSAATGLEWATVSAGNAYSLITSISTNGANTYTVSSLGSYNSVFCLFISNSWTAANDGFRVRFNSDSSSVYNTTGSYGNASEVDTGMTYLQMAYLSTSGDTMGGYMYLYGMKSTGPKIGHYWGIGSAVGNSRHKGYSYTGSSAVTSITFYSGSANNLDNGSIYVYGSAN